MKKYPEAINVKVLFNGCLMTLANSNDRQKTTEGVEIWLQKQPGGAVRPMASIPDGTLDKYKHCRPEIIEQDWDWSGVPEPCVSSI